MLKPNNECSSRLYSVDDDSILRALGLVKHPQVMSCIYITLFLVTMLIISQQVMTEIPLCSFCSCSPIE